MNELIELIKRIGIFMIAAQAVLHFAPGQKYEKYIKLIIGTLILLQFATPMSGILSRAETDWDGKLSEMEALFGESGLTEEMESAPTAADVLVDNLENEMKSRLNQSISEEPYTVSNVQVHMKSLDEDGSRQYELEKVRVVVYWNADKTQMDNAVVEKIQIDKIDVSMNTEERQEDAETGEKQLFRGESEELAERLRVQFARLLGLEEEIMEVSVYGTDEKADQ